MTVGDTTTSALTDSMPYVIAEARQVREFEGVMPNLVDRQTLGKGKGHSWNEITLAQLTAQAVTEETELDNPQQMADSLFAIRPTQTGIHTFVSNRVADQISQASYAKMGNLAQNAIQRKKDEDGLAVLDGASVSLPGAGSTLTSGVIRAAARRITSNATEPGHLPIRAVLHGFQIKDFEDELLGGVGTYPIESGLTKDVYAQMFQGMIGSAQIHEDGNITIDGSDDAKGGVFAKDAIVLVQGHELRHYTRFEPHKGGGGTSMWIYDDYAYGERSAGNWLYEVYSDATTPTS